MPSCDSEDATCEKKVTAVLTFWDNVCWGTGIYCDGEQVNVKGREGAFIGGCDSTGITCDGPGVETYEYVFDYSGGECEYCSSAEGTEVCVPLTPDCSDQTVEVTASGSEESGPHPMVCCPDDPDCV